MAPFEAIIIAGPKYTDQANQVYDLLSTDLPSIDCIIDDRDESFGSKMNDAELIGHPIIVRIGNSWHDEACKCLVQCRKPVQMKEDVPLATLKQTVLEILAQL